MLHGARAYVCIKRKVEIVLVCIPTRRVQSLSSRGQVLATPGIAPQSNPTPKGVAEMTVLLGVGSQINSNQALAKDCGGLTA